MPEENIDKFISRVNTLGAYREPFLFIIDSGLKRHEVHKLDKIPPGIFFSTPLASNNNEKKISPEKFTMNIKPVSYRRYHAAFSRVMENIMHGNTYLLNLTFPTRIKTGLTLDDIFRLSVARYKLLYYNYFVVFSPEIFVRINEGQISSFPMKGTIDASVNNASEIILKDKKEKAEHDTIVDLIRNDLSMVSTNVAVARYRYIETIKTRDRELLQVSSEITGKLEEGYERRLGNIIATMLPAGSVTGAPKRETIRIIRECEKYDRGWYTGIFGVFDGRNLDSAVMIRFIERDSRGFVYKSGGGITCMSDPRKEYDELIAKVYVPVG